MWPGYLIFFGKFNNSLLLEVFFSSTNQSIWAGSLSFTIAKSSNDYCKLYHIYNKQNHKSFYCLLITLRIRRNCIKLTNTFKNIRHKLILKRKKIKNSHNFLKSRILSRFYLKFLILPIMFSLTFLYAFRVYVLVRKIVL